MKKDKKIKLAVWCCFVFLLLASLVAEQFITFHPFFELDAKMFFHAWFGFVSCIFMVIFSKILGLFLKRSEGYYKENSHE